MTAEKPNEKPKMTDELSLAQRLAELLKIKGTYPDTERTVGWELTKKINNEHAENGGGGS